MTKPVEPYPVPEHGDERAHASTGDRNAGDRNAGERGAGERGAFVVPAGLRLELGGTLPTGVRVEHDGDVEIAADLGWQFSTLRAGGDLTVLRQRFSGDLLAGGVLRVTGDIDTTGVLHGREVILGDQAIRCRVISADERITIGAATLSVEIILAPEVRIDPRAQGRVTVIESYNARPATKIKGSFTLAEYEDMFGNSLDFLAQRGLAPLSGPRPPGDRDGTPRHEVFWDAAPTPVNERTLRGTFDREDVLGEDVPTPIGNRPRRGHEEDVEDPVSMSIEDLQAAGRRTRAEDELHVRLTNALERIVACYAADGAPPTFPPAVMQLRTYVEQRDYAGLRAHVGDLWTSLLTHHQKRGMRPHHQVTHAFNVIHGLVHG